MNTSEISIPPRFHVRLNEEHRAILAANILKNPRTAEKAASELLAQKLDELAGKPAPVDPIEAIASSLRSIESKVEQLVAMHGQNGHTKDSVAAFGQNLVQIRDTIEQVAARSHLTPADLSPLLCLLTTLVATVGQLTEKTTPTLLPALVKTLHSTTNLFNPKRTSVALSKLSKSASNWSGSCRGTLGYAVSAMFVSGVLAWPLSKWEARLQQESVMPASKSAQHETPK